MMKTTFTGRSRFALLLSLTGLLCLTFAASKARADEGDPPNRVARISYLDGSVSFQPGGQGDWASAAKNRPVTIGDKLWADKDSRAELQAGQASIHVGSMTALSFLNLDDNTIQMRLAEGSINFRIRELREGEVYEADTPNLAFTVKRAGAFRIDVSENGDSSRVTVIRGEGEVTAGGQTYAVHEGERAEFNGTDNIQYSTERAPAPDGLDRWANERDLHEENSVSAKYVSRDTVGYSDLDDYGTWDEVPEYGHVWYPTVVDAGWAPYSYGYWNWVGPWGWTWIGYEPWGFAPYHYGRWSYIGGRWGWCPGPYSYWGRPYYGPAFVGFLGGAHWGVGFGFGGGFGVGWFPLGWGECYHPWYRASNFYIRNVNIHNTYIRNTNFINSAEFRNTNYRYAHDPRAVTATSHNSFVNGERINRGANRVTAASLRGAEVSTRASLNPSGRQSYVGASNMNGRVSTPSAAIQNRAVVARSTPAAGASHMPVRTMNSASMNQGRTFNAQGANRPNMSSPANGSFNAHGNSPVNGSVNSGVSNRARQLSENRPPSAMSNGNNRGSLGNNNSVSQNRSASNARTWEAQGNTTDRGRAPAGFGSNSPPNEPTRSARMNQNDRPTWARSESNGGNRNSMPSNNSRSYEPQRSMPSSGGNRGYAEQRSSTPPSRSYSEPSRTYSAPSRSYPSSGGGRSYSAPSRTYSAPSAPSHSSGGGGGNHGGGGGGAHSSGGGGSSHGGGGSHGGGRH